MPREDKPRLARSAIERDRKPSPGERIDCTRCPVSALCLVLGFVEAFIEFKDRVPLEKVPCCVEYARFEMLVSDVKTWDAYDGAAWNLDQYDMCFTP